MTRKFLFIAGYVMSLFFYKQAFAISVSQATVDMGTVVQTSRDVVISYDGGCTSGCTGAKKMASGSFTVTKGNYQSENLNFSNILDQTLKLSDGSCSINIGGIKINENSNTDILVGASGGVLNCNLPESVTASVSATTISINGKCTEGLQTVDFNISPQSQACWYMMCTGKCVSGNAVTLNVVFSFNFQSFISASPTQELDFGEILLRSYDQTVRMNLNGEREGAMQVGRMGQAGVFDIQGIQKSEFTVQVASPVTLKAEKGASTMTATLFHDAVDNKLVFGDDGKAVLRVGGELSVPSTLKDIGNYAGDYLVTVSY